MKLLTKALFLVLALHAAPAIAQEAPVAGTAILGVQVDVKGVSATGYRATKLLGSEVYNDQNEKVGKLDDLIVAGDGQVTLAVLSVGGFLGIGGKKVAVPIQLFKAGGRGKILLPKATKDELKRMPEFKYAQK
ncbi:MAG: PRC-barrel domain-containing protein [Methyloceanibacter sp.]|jgi:sporulation protein YlmC with PRC-barrel domain